MQYQRSPPKKIGPKSKLPTHLHFSLWFMYTGMFASCRSAHRLSWLICIMWSGRDAFRNVCPWVYWLFCLPDLWLHFAIKVKTEHNGSRVAPLCRKTCLRAWMLSMSSNTTCIKGWVSVIGCNCTTVAACWTPTRETLCSLWQCMIVQCLFLFETGCCTAFRSSVVGCRVQQ